MTRSSMLVSALAVLTAAILPAAASAATPDAPWSGTGTATATVQSDGTAADPKFEYAVAGSSGSWTFNATSQSARRQPVDWRYTGFHAWFGVRVAIEKYVIRGGQEIVKEPLASGGPVNCCAAPSGGFTYSGSTTFDLKPGDEYGFRMSGSHGDSDRRLLGNLVLTATDVTPPAIVPVVRGTKGSNGYYTSDVDVAWKVDDPDSRVTRDVGCDPATVTADTAGRTFTCTALSAGGKHKESVTIKRDTAAPALSVPNTILKEGAGPVDYAATATDGVDARPSLLCSPPSGTAFPLGATKVNCTATDAAGHTVAKDFEVLVLRGAQATVAPSAAKKLDARLAVRATVRKRITRIRKLTVKNVAAGTVVTVSCKGPSCPKKLRGTAVARRAAETSLDISSLVKGRLKPGTVVSVAVSGP